MEECAQSDSYRKQSADARSVLLALNVADDYFKARKQVEELTEELEAKDKELYDIKHELIAAQIKMESKDKMIKDYQKELSKT